MKYLIAVLIFAIGLGLMIWGTTSTDEVTLFGMTFHPRIGKGAGIIGMTAGVITFLALFGSSLPPTSPAGRKG